MDGLTYHNKLHKVQVLKHLIDYKEIQILSKIFKKGGFREKA